MTSSIRCIIVSTRPPKNQDNGTIYNANKNISNIAATTPINNEI